MKTGFKTGLAIAAAAWPLFTFAAEKPAPTNQLDKVSYAVGINFGNTLKSAGFEVDADVMAQAVKDVLAGHELKMTEQQSQEVIGEYRNQVRAKRDADRIQKAAKNRAAGEKFLAENARKPGVKIHSVTMPDGTTADMQYKVLTDGAGESAKMTDTAKFSFRGTHIDGTEFDNTSRRGGSTTFPVGRVPIRGLSEALTLMKPGSKWVIFLPASLAFGDFPGGPNVEPGSTLIFEVELLGIEAPPAEPAAAKPLTSDVIKVPSREDIDKGAKIEIIPAQDAERMARSNATVQPKKP
jgi:FKBP-type peptidyl-prolyl cis-trans isomerase FklB